MESIMSIFPIIFMLAIIVAVVTILLRALNNSKPNTDLERRVEILEKEITNLKNNK
ncbi:hypothetical protein [Oceanobacillus arenosus]|uniref:hypothetical protein n=1 Tax=Oceanobacillus arenosus TaxID=1229153 RepID=UPI0014752C7F|nr:hypothetical protein [Oceanobacillus arenosus]